jgi:hypothetical protein
MTLFFLAACATKPQPVVQPATVAQPAPVSQPQPAGSRRLSVPLPARGTTCATAVGAQGKNEREGLASEGAWIRDNYPGAKKVSQSLTQCDGKPADVVEIRTADGQSVKVYFDISEWFGKM